MADPLNEKTRIGPMAKSELLDQVHKQVTNSVALGAKVLYGGKPQGKFIYPPTLIVNVSENMPVFEEEVFGPVIAIAKVKNEAQAIKLANSTEYGLSAVVFTENVKRAKKEIVPLIQSGMVFVNEISKSIVQVPFGGTKSSGTGRELGEQGIKEFCNAKTVYIS